MLTAAHCQAANGWNAPFKGIFSRRGAEAAEFTNSGCAYGATRLKSFSLRPLRLDNCSCIILLTDILS